MKNQLLVSSFILMSSAAALAGGISGGGGGTTVPDPIKADRLSWQIEQFTPSIAYSWVRGAERRYQGLSAADKANSPLKRLFNSDKNIYQLLRSVRIELHETTPCLDFDGVEREGSVRTQSADAVCLSTFLMAPKLNVAMAIKEASALYVHELSHRAGADEPEAVAIQKLMLSDLMYANPAKIVSGAQFAAGFWLADGAQWFVKQLIKNPVQIDASEMDKIHDHFDKSVDALDLEGEWFSAVGAGIHDEVLPNRALIEAMRDYLCTVNPKLPAKQRQACAQQIKKEFAGAKQVSARDYLLRRVGYPGSALVFNPDDLPASVDRVQIPNVQSRADVVKALQQLQAFLLRTGQHIEELSHFTITIVKM